MPGHCSIYCFLPEYKLSDFSYFDIASGTSYFKPTSSSFLQSNLCKALSKDSELKVSCYFSGTFFQNIANNTDEYTSLSSFISNGQIELLAGPYYHSFSCLFSSTLFKQELHAHSELINRLFHTSPVGFYNTLAIFSNDLIPALIKNKINYAIAPKVAWFAGEHSKNAIFKSLNEKLSLILTENGSGSEDVIIRYISGNDATVVPSGLKALSASESVQNFKTEACYSLPNPIGLDTQGKDLTYYLGNALQKQVFKKITELSTVVTKKKNAAFIENLLSLGTPTILGSMNQENPFRYDRYNSVINCLTDLELKLN